jgi:hypothetical protein
MNTIVKHISHYFKSKLWDTYQVYSNFLIAHIINYYIVIKFFLKKIKDYINFLMYLPIYYQL